MFDIVADGNADVLADMIAFSGAQHMSELRSKKQEDYGRNLLHCAVANGQLKTLQVLLKHDAFDPNQARAPANFEQGNLRTAGCCLHTHALAFVAQYSVDRPSLSSCAASQNTYNLALLARSHTCCSPRLLVYNLKEPSPILVRSSLKRVKVDSVYTRSTPLMEVVKIGGRLDLVECLLAAGARLDVQVSG